MADEEAEQEGSGGEADAAVALAEVPYLSVRLQELESRLRESGESGVQAATDYCQRFCQTLLEYAEKWKTSEDPLPLLEVYTVAIQSYSKARPYLTSECENVAFVLERLALSCVELLLCLPQELPDKHWEEFQTSVQVSHKKLMEHGSFELRLLSNLTQENGVWRNPLLQSILSQEPLEQERVNEFLILEGPILLGMRIKHLLKIKQVSQATALAKTCTDNQEINTKGSFTQLYLVCLCAASPNIKLMETIANVDCKDALEMICNLESEGDEKTALILCAAFLSRQLQHGEMYCAWELTLFWSKLQQRVDPSIQVYLERCRQLSLLTKTVYHIFFLIKVIQSETEGAGLATCIELCVRALRLDSSENTNVKISVCKTISCLLPDDLEVKRACQLSEFLLEPTVDAYYAVEMLYNQPDQKYDEESLPVPNSLRCELLLVLKTRWPFDPEFWDWKTLKRHCLSLMGEEASIVSSIDELNDTEVYEKLENFPEENIGTSINGIANFYDEGTNILKNIQDEKQKKREIKKMREKGFISARFRNWQAYMQYCVLCDKEFLGHRIVRHAQKHYKDGIYTCPICAKNFVAKDIFVPHVTLHVKQSCKERLAVMKPLRRLGRPTKIESMNRKANAKAKQEQRPIKKNSLYSEDFIVFNDNDGSDDDKDRAFECEISPIQKQATVNEFSCPVTLCKKGFKYLKNLIAHVKAHRDDEEAKRFLEIQSKKVICHYCRRHFVSVAHLNDHLQMHCGSKPYICIQMQCKAGFNSYAELLTHRKEHPVFRAMCMFPKCGRIFSGAYLLYDHEAQHYNTYTCKFTGCGKLYHSETELQKHLDDHGTASKDVLKTDSQTDSYTELAHPQAEDSLKASVTIDQILNSDPVSNNLASLVSHTIDEIKADPVVANQVQFSTGTLCTDGLDHTTNADVLSQVSSPPTNVLDQILLPPTGMLGQGLSPTIGALTQDLSPDINSLEQVEAGIISSTLKMPPLNPGMHIFMKPSKLSAASSVINTGNALLEQIYTTVEEAYNNSSVPVLPEIKRKSINQPQAHDVSNSGISKIENHDSQTIARHVSNMAPFNIQSQALYESGLAMPEFKDTIKAAANLFNLPLKALEDIPFIQPQSSLDTPLPAPSVPQPAPVQKFNCTVEGCTRIYNSIQSIGKHMKTTHPDHYPAFQLERKMKKSQRSRNLVKATSDGKLAFCKPSQVVGPSNSAFPQQKKGTVNPSYSKQVQSITNSLFPTSLDSLASPVLSSVESIIDQGLSSHVKSDPETVLNSQAESLTNAAFTSQLKAIAKAVLPLKFENGSDPFLPQSAECSSAAGFPSLMGIEKNTVFSHLETNANLGQSSTVTGDGNSGFPEEKSIPDTVFSSKVNNSSTEKLQSLSETNFMQTSSEKKKESRGRGPKRERKPKHNTRAKWPAIIRDGKFICSRCFRVFTNPRSLGGHLSKRSSCKSVDEAEISQEDLRSSGKASLLANIILSSSSAQNVRTSPQSVVNPEVCLKDQSFLQSLTEDHSTFLQKPFPKLSATNFNSRLNENGSKIVKQALETTATEIERKLVKQELDTTATEIENKIIKRELDTTATQIGSKVIKQALETTGILENTEMLPLLMPDIDIPSAIQINRDDLSKKDLSPLLQDVCKRDTLMTDGDKMQKIEESDFHIFSAEDLLKTVENGLSSKPFSNGGVTSQSITSNSSRVSVISSPQSRATAQMNKKGSSSSKKKKKTSSVLLATSTNQNLLADELTARSLAKNIEGNDQKSHSLPNFVANCESQLLQNLTQKCNSDNQICVADTQENIKTNMEPLSVLAHQTIKVENCDPPLTPCSCNIKGHSDLKIPSDTIQKLKKTVSRQIMKTKINSKSQIPSITNKLVVSTDGQSILPESPQNLKANCNAQLLIANDLEKVTTTDITEVSVCATAINSTHVVNSSLSEVLQKDDTQVMDILEQFQKLKLENDVVIASVDCNTSLSVPVSALLSVTTASTQPVPETDFNQLLDKINKPFVCREQDCNYSAMTKDALFKHYSKVHQYTQDMVLEIKKNQLKFAPFRCVVPSCPKTFTRNSNLRAHCQSVHHFTSEEMVKLKIKRPYGRRSLNETSNSTPQTIEIKKLKKTTVEVGKKSEPPLVVTEGMKEIHINHCEQELESKQEYLPGVVTVSQDKTKVLSSNKKINKELKCRRNPKARRESKVRRESKGRKDLKGLQELKGVKGIKELKGNKIRRHRKEKDGSKRKRPEETNSFPGVYSPYRPYRCVHQGCVAAFTIQQNLTLHYQAVHKSELPNFSLQLEEDSDLSKGACDGIETKEGVKEFRCQESDCSRIFQEVASLIQHYIKLHELIPEEIESMMSVINFGKFNCDQLQCTCTFTAPSNYISHLEIDHGIKIKQKMDEDCIYKCDCEGCDRVYATRSNLLRHIYNKHNDKHKAHLIRPRKLTDDEENVLVSTTEEKLVKVKHRTKIKLEKELKATKIKRRKICSDSKNSQGGHVQKNKPLISLKCGKHNYSIKTRNEALLECSDKLTTQYPCMIKECSSVVTSQRNIIRHYKCHRLSRAFVLQNKNILLVCRRRSSSHAKVFPLDQVGTEDKMCVAKESDIYLSESSDELSISSSQSETGKDEMDELTELFITKLINEDNKGCNNKTMSSSSANSDIQETSSCSSEKQRTNSSKRAKKENYVSPSKRRKVESLEELSAVEVSSTHSGEETAIAIQTTEEPPPFDWSSFKPMGFEVSFLKFLEESAVKQKKNMDRECHVTTSKGSLLNGRKLNEKIVMEDSNQSWTSSESETFVQFANPSQLQFCENVQFVLDKTLKDITELVLKQLQEMKPTVVLEEIEEQQDGSILTVAKKLSFDSDERSHSTDNIL